MIGTRIPITIHLHGTLAANAVGTFRLSCPATLIHVSAVASNNSDATLKIGTSADDDGILVAVAIGDSATPTVFDRGDFDGALISPAGECYHGAETTVYSWTLDYDGASGTAAQNVEIIFTFTEG